MTHNSFNKSNEVLILDGDEFMLCLDALNYPIPEGGACFGVTAKSIDAILLRQMVEFDSRIVKIKKIVDQAKKDAIQENKNSDIKSADDKRLNDEIKVKIKKYIEEEDKDWNLRSFLEGVAVHQYPQVFKFLFEEKQIPLQDLSLTHKLLQPKELQDKKDDKGKTVLVGSFSGAYTLEGLKTYFNCIGRLSINFPVASSLSSTNHTIADGYDKKGFMIVNINYLPSLKLDITKADQHAQIIKIFISSKAADAAIFQTNVYVLNESLEEMQQHLKRLIENPDWQRLHQVTPTASKLTDSSGSSWLHVAAQNGALMLVKELLENGADPNLANCNGTTPLYFAAQNGHTECARLLLRYDANPNLANNSSQTILMTAVVNGQTEIARLLLEHKADIHQKTPAGNTALSLAINKENFEKENRIKEIQLLLQYGATVGDIYELHHCLKVFLPEEIDKISDQIKLIIKNEFDLHFTMGDLPVENLKALLSLVDLQKLIRNKQELFSILNSCTLDVIPFFISKLGKEYIKSIVPVFNRITLKGYDRYCKFYDSPGIADLIKANINNDVNKLTDFLKNISPENRVNFVTQHLGVDYFKTFLKKNEKGDISLNYFEDVISEKQLHEILEYQSTLSAQLHTGSSLKKSGSVSMYQPAEPSSQPVEDQKHKSKVEKKA